MLILKKNIYDRREISPNLYPLSSDIDYDELFDPLNLLSVALEEESDVISFLKRQPTEYWPQDSKKFYPKAHKMGSYTIFDNLLQILKCGLGDPDTWQVMNTYHFCFLYDVLVRFSFNYNHDNKEGRLAILPELAGKPFQIELFIKEYFFNTVFLLNDEQYNSLTREEKIKLGYDCPFQFAVVNGLIPTKNEIKLQSSPDYPYSIYV
jgi:hypothetical protein